MADPLLPEAKPNWTNAMSVNPGWSDVNLTQSASWVPLPDLSNGNTVYEVGYGQGGFGEGGYDTPTIIYPPASTPNWAVEVLK